MSQEKILIIDDDDQIRTLLAERLKFHQYRVSTAEDGEDGLERFRKEGADLVLLDLMMPKLDGFQVLEALKADDQLQAIPVIVVTARALTPHERKRLSDQVQILWEKGSFLSDELLEDIDATLG